MNTFGYAYLRLGVYVCVCNRISHVMSSSLEQKVVVTFLSRTSVYVFTKLSSSGLQQLEENVTSTFIYGTQFAQQSQTHIPHSSDTYGFPSLSYVTERREKVLSDYPHSNFQFFERTNSPYYRLIAFHILGFNRGKKSTIS